MPDASFTFGSEQRAALKAVIEARSFRVGEEFTLVSGAKSTVYFDMKPTMLDPQGAWLLALAVGAAAVKCGADYVGGLEMGAVPIAAGLAPVAHRAGWPLRVFFVRKQAKAHGAMKLIEGLTAEESLAGKRVAILEDVTTSGGSALKAVEAVRAAGGVVEDLITIVDREAGAGPIFAANGLKLTALFTMSDFVGPDGPR